MLETFRNELAQEQIEQEIVLIPSSFEIQKTVYGPIEAQVIVLAKFSYSNYLEIKQYIYYLQRQDGVWIVHDYEIRNLGTE